MPRHILAIGSANVDFSMRVPRFPRTGESVNGGPFIQSFGGKGSNQAIAARRAGARVAAVFSLGGDVFAERLLNLYEQEGIDTRHVRTNEGLQCGTGIMLVDDNGDNRICTSLEANERMDADMVNDARELFFQASLLMLQMEIPDAAIDQAISLAQRYAVPVMLNVAPARDTTVAIDCRIEYLVVNESEAAALTGTPVHDADTGFHAARALAERGPATVIVTLGDRGSVVHDRDGSVHIPAYPIDAVDATAAGDCFCGALAAGLGEGMTIRDACRFATAGGALCAGVFGALPSLPTRKNIIEFLHAHG